MLEYIYYQPTHYQVDAIEILKEIGEQPHMLLRISIRGGHFPHRNAAAFARIQENDSVVLALYCEIDEDEAGFRAYFPTDVVLNGILSIGYGNEVVVEFEFERLKLEPQKLEERRIKTTFHRVTQKDLGVFNVQR